MNKGYPVYDEGFVDELKALGLGDVPRFIVSRDATSPGHFDRNENVLFGARSIDEAVEQMVEAVAVNSSRRYSSSGG